ncbi:hypothetical protein J3R83DRAFT_13460 [Lanmaoa asiatica]|nr:hypothetical protein J3R83DRAFT_13460 [Lanmaoa asiatica]
MRIPGVIQQLWLHGDLESAMEILSRDIVLNGNSHHAFANRALVQARLQKWGNALVDAETVINHASFLDATLKYNRQSIDIQPSVIGCIARSIALGGQGRHEDSMQAFDLAFSYCRAEQVNYLLLVKSVILFLAGLHRHAIARTIDLVKSLPGKLSHCYVVQ